MMLKVLFVMVIEAAIVLSYPQTFHTEKFRIGIEYDNSLPMQGGSERYRHRNNYDPFFVTITTKAKNNYVITYLDVTVTVDEGAEIDFRMVRGQSGSRTMAFQVVSNHSDFLYFTYLTYGIREEDYRKITNVITIPMPNVGWSVENNLFYTSCIILYNFINHILF